MKKRLDALLVERGLASDLKEAQALILARRIALNPPPQNKSPVQVLKPGSLISPEASLAVSASARFVSRGGEKLEAALDFWRISVKNQVCLDVGASTGGFTDCLLARGASRIYAVDVGYGQFHPKLRADPRVRLFEKTHFLQWSPGWTWGFPAIAVIDLSFISLAKVFPRLSETFAGKSSPILALIKPQFEAPPKDLRKGILKDESARVRAIEGLLAQAEKERFEIHGRFPCPVKGAKGNREEWAYLTRRFE